MFLRQKNKKQKNIFRKEKKAFTLIEMLVVLFMFSLITMTFYKVFSLGTIIMLDAKKRVAAANVASEKIEIIRGLDYEDIGTGVIDPDEYVTSGNYQFHVKTSIGYFDNTQDGTGAGDVTGIDDYKRAIITVSWGGEGDHQQVRVYSDFSPFGVEEPVSGTGTLSVRVIDSTGAAVDNATVVVSNSEEGISNAIYYTVDGYANITTTPVSDQKYEIVVSKSGYDGANTLPPYPISSFYPADVHGSVVENDVSESVIPIGALSGLRIQFLDAYGESLAGSINFNMKGGRIMGTDTSSVIMYNYDEAVVTDGNGLEEINDLSPGNYEITLDETGYILWRVSSSTGNNPNEIIIPPGVSSYEEGIKILNESNPSYFVHILDSETGFPLQGATVDVSNSVLGYSESINTDEYGYAYFPVDSALTMTNGETYDVSVSFSGYNDENGTVVINNLTQETINLVP